MFEVEPRIDDAWSLRIRQINAESAEQIQEYLAMLVTNANEERRQTRSRVTQLLEDAKAELGGIDGRTGGRIEGVNDARSGSSDPTTDAPATASQQSYESDVDGKRQTRLTEFFCYTGRVDSLVRSISVCVCAHICLQERRPVSR